MAKYLKTAGEANNVAVKLLALVPEADKPIAAEMIARLVNYGIRCNPRACMSTIRLNAVRHAVSGLPVKVTMEERTGTGTNRKTGRPFTYNALITTPIGGPAEVKPTEEGQNDDEE